MTTNTTLTIACECGGEIELPIAITVINRSVEVEPNGVSEPCTCGRTMDLKDATSAEFLQITEPVYFHTANYL